MAAIVTLTGGAEARVEDLLGHPTPPTLVTAEYVVDGPSSVSGTAVASPFRMFRWNPVAVDEEAHRSRVGAVTEATA